MTQQKKETLSPAEMFVMAAEVELGWVKRGIYSSLDYRDERSERRLHMLHDTNGPAGRSRAAKERGQSTNGAAKERSKGSRGREGQGNIPVLKERT